MQHDAIPSDLPRAPFDLNAFAKQAVLAGIDQAIDDPAEMKARIMLAFQCEHLTADETHAMITKHKLENV
jgi:hypothetical protein